MLKKRFLSMMLTVVMVLSMLPANFTKSEVQAASTGTRVVGYFPSYRMGTLNSIDFSALTHCILSFMTYGNGTLTSGFYGSELENVVSKCHANNVKAMIAIGGWGGFNASDNPFSTAEKRTSFVNQVMTYVDRYNLDGVDIDIELTDYNIWSNYEALISELSGRLKSEGKLLTMAVSTWFTDAITNSTYQYFDFLNLMSYDYNQSGTGEVAPWSQIYNMISYYKGKGVSDDKLVIGVPFYGYGAGGTAYTYAEMINQSTANSTSDYANGVYYNGMNTIKEKAEYSKSYGGTMIWEIGQDSFGQYSLLNVIKEVMADGSESSTTQGGQEKETTTPSTGGSTTTYPQWDSSSIYTKGMKVVYNGKVYEAGWWTQGDTPGSASVWTLTGETVAEPTEKPTEEPTEEPTPEIKTNVKLEVNGCQISTTAEGFRVVYSVSDVDNEVDSVGLVYGLADSCTTSEMIVGSTNSTVHSYAATEKGKMSGTISSLTDAQSYVRTMEFIKTAEFFNSKINVRSYAKLKTGEYVYSDISQFTIYNVADYLYQNKQMNNYSGHDYLYREILKLVNPTYANVDYDFGNMLVK